MRLFKFVFYITLLISTYLFVSHVVSVQNENAYNAGFKEGVTTTLDVVFPEYEN